MRFDLRIDTKPDRKSLKDNLFGFDQDASNRRALLAVDEVGRGIRHAPSAAGRAESPRSARERDESIVPACATVHA
jgi:hypothetical protein